MGSKITLERIEALDDAIMDILEKKTKGEDDSGMSAPELKFAKDFIDEKRLELNPEVDEGVLDDILTDDDELPFSVISGGKQ